EIRASTRKSFLDAMLSVHLATYAPGAPHTRSLCAALTSARPRLGGIGQTLLQHIPSVLDPVAAPRAIADRMLEMDDCWTGLKACSLRSPHAPGLMDHAHLVFVQKLAPAFQPALEKLFAWLKPPGQPVRMSGAAEAITAVLKPWLTSDPPKDRIASITETLIAFYHDPRVSRSGAWASVPERELAVLLRWLTGENIRFFLDVVSAVEESHMWEPRRKFWLGLYEQKRIDAAWVAFSGRAASLARRQVDAGGKRGLLSFGRQTAGGGRTDTSLLILKIGSKIVVEGSHSYKVHVFSVDDPNAPRLYQPNYDCEHIRSLHGAQAKPHLGDWQGWVRERI
ncbi:MAG TPA: EH signature domain-containing protein, partial [Fimbriimonadaceae bacterium]|nr:EH signature domain-containing protein [Fimbriimonadaceae bacterium]